MITLFKFLMNCQAVFQRGCTILCFYQQCLKGSSFSISSQILVTVSFFIKVILTLLHCWWACKLVQPLWRTVWRFLKKLELVLPYDPAIPLLGIHTEETRIERDTCTPMFITALFTIARTWRQPWCPLADKWIRKLWYIYAMEYYSAIKKNAFESVLMRWMKLEPIIQSEVSQKEKHQYCILMHVYGFRKMVMITLYVRQQKRHRCKEQSFGLCGRRWAWDDLTE